MATAMGIEVASAITVVTTMGIEVAIAITEVAAAEVASAIKVAIAEEADSMEVVESEATAMVSAAFVAASSFAYPPSSSSFVLPFTSSLQQFSFVPLPSIF